MSPLNDDTLIRRGNVKLWLDTWVTPNACKLVPELRDAIERARKAKE